MNETKNQHFISQVEQRLNTSTPDAKEENCKIYQFNIVDKENFHVQLQGNVKIKVNLSDNDLFSYDVLDKTYRYNFEQLFSHYEKSIPYHTKILIAHEEYTDQQRKTAAIELFLSKMLNVLRNPYSIKEAIYVFEPVLGIFEDDNIRQVINRILEGNKPHLEYICKKFNFSCAEYHKWLSIIFAMLGKEKKESIFNKILADALFKNQCEIIVGKYNKEFCLLTDQGYIKEGRGDKSLYCFNLTSHAFIIYKFHNDFPPLGFIPVRTKNGNLHDLEFYNKAVVENSYHFVYSGGKNIPGININ